jgi:RNA polymerase sigma-70 factor (ECF subfamily)
METAHRARGGRRHNLSLRQLAPLRGRRDRDAAAAHTAFEAFYREHVAAVYQYALAVLANPTDAEDVTQQTFLNAYRAFERGERPEKPHNWLIKIAHNVCRMRWRQSARRPQELPLESAREPATHDEEKPGLDDVLSALGRLPFNQRAALVMRELEDRSYAEIAEVLGTSVSAVEALLFRARTNLRASRKAIGALTFVPVPASLGSFFGGGSGGGLLAAGGIALGTDVVLKAAAVVATGVVLGGVGYKSVNAVADTSQPAFAAAKHQYQSQLVWGTPADRFIRAVELARGADGRGGVPGMIRDLGPDLILVGGGLGDKDTPGAAEAAAAAGAPGAAAAAAGAGAGAGVPAVAGVPATAAPGIPGPSTGAAPAPVGGATGTVGAVTSVIGATPGPSPPPPSPAPQPPPVVLPPAPPPPVPVPTVSTPVPTVPTVPTVPVTVPTLPLPPPPPILP